MLADVTVLSQTAVSLAPGTPVPTQLASSFSAVALLSLVKSAASAPCMRPKPTTKNAAIIIRFISSPRVQPECSISIFNPSHQTIFHRASPSRNVKV